MTWEIVIGLEVHAQLSTSSKIFCGASTSFGAEPNRQADAVSLALPGVLPVLNRGAVERAIRFGLATGAHIAPRSVFARKNYFYPDLPKGYQISQFDLPVVGNGQLVIQVPAQGNSPAYEKTVRITRAHLEEDAGKSLHEDFHGMTGIDLNRAGTPLLEIVSEPDMRSAAEAVAYAKTLHTLVRWIGICDGNMQEGSFRCDANVSMHKVGTPFGTRREIKNLNSFRFLEQAINYEVQWQIDTLENGGAIHQATVLFDPDKGETRMMRSKEEAHDYRYFPDPDLLPLEISEAWKNAIRETMVELPHEMCERFERDLGLSRYDATTLVTSFERAIYFDWVINAQGVRAKDNAKLCANWVIGEVAAQLNREGLEIHFNALEANNEWMLYDPSTRKTTKFLVSPSQLGKLITRIADGTVSNSGAKEVFRNMWSEGGDADAIIEAKGLKQVSDSGAIEALVDEILAANADKVAEYRSGKDKLFGFFVGLAMKASKGKANPAQLNEALKRKLAD